MKRTLIIFLTILFCFLAYLEAVAQEISTDTVALASSSEKNVVAIAEPDISEIIDYGLQIICESEGGVYRIDFKNGFECGGLEVGYN